MVNPSRVRFEIRLPAFYNDGTPIEPKKYIQTKNEILRKFGGITLLTITQGGWVDPKTNKTYVEEMGGFFVDADKERLDETIEFFKGYKKILEKRFKQKIIYIVGYEVYVI